MPISSRALHLIVMSFVIVILMTACSKPRPNTPMTVAQAFWTASLDGDVQTAKQYLTPQSRPNFKIILKSNKDFVELGEQSITVDQAEILTQLTQHHGEKVNQVALRTVLVNIQGQWFIDFDKTRDSMLGSELQSALDQLTSTMMETIDKSVKVMGESMRDELQEMERSLQGTLDELNRELELQERQQQSPSIAPEMQESKPL
jgi:hypothetical protein